MTPASKSASGGIIDGLLTGKSSERSDEAGDRSLAEVRRMTSGKTLVAHVIDKQMRMKDARVTLAGLAEVLAFSIKFLGVPGEPEIRT